MERCSEIIFLPLSTKEFNTYELVTEFINNLKKHGRYYHYKRSINFNDKVLILFQYQGTLIASAVLLDKIDEEIYMDNTRYNGKYVFDKSTITIFDTPITSDEYKQIDNTFKNFNQSFRRTPLENLDKVINLIQEHKSNNNLTNLRTDFNVLRIAAGEENIMDETESFYDYLKNNGFLFEGRTVENYLLSLKTKPFVILAGNSGTGKTKIAQLFAQYLSEYVDIEDDYSSFESKLSESVDIVDDGEYFSFECKPTKLTRKLLKNGAFGFPIKTYLNPIIDFKKLSDDVITLDINGFKTKAHLQINMGMYCGDENLSDYFKESINKPSFSIKIKKIDIYDSLLDIDELLMEDSEFISKMGVRWDWTVPIKCWENNFVPLKRTGNLDNIIIDGKPTSGNYKINKIEFYLREPDDLRDYLIKLSSENPDKNLNFKLNISRDELENVINYEYFENINNSVEFNEEYLETQIPIGSKQVKNSVFKEVLPLDLYYRNCDYIIDGFHIKGTIHPYVKLNLKENTTTGNLKIRYDDIKDLISDEGYLVDSFDTKVRVGSSYYRHTWDLSKYNNIRDLIPIKSYYNECEVIVDGVPQKNTISIYPVVRFDKDEELEEHLKKLYDEDPSQLIDLKINLKNIKKDKPITRTIESNYEIVPVGANWIDNRNVLGYENIITKSYQSTPALELIMKAIHNPGKPFFLILDEMNLSNVERYFSDFLSAIESEEKIPLYTPNMINYKGERVLNEELYTIRVDGVDYNIPSKLKIPDNLFIIGTVNVDETTYMFSPKVLDRANVLEFSTYPVGNYLSEYTKREDPSGDIRYLEKLVNKDNPTKWFIKDLKNKLPSYVWKNIVNELDKFQIILEDTGFDFGFRVTNEILRFMTVSNEYYGDEWKWYESFDVQIKQKILPKLHGAKNVIGETLNNLLKLCYYGSEIKFNRETKNIKEVLKYYEIPDEENNPKYKESYKKLENMNNVLEKQRYVSFIN